MDVSFWVRMHGGATHFPIALTMVAVLFDSISMVVRNETRRRDFRAVGFYSLLIGALLSIGAVVSGLVLSKGVIFGDGLIARHHKFVWPAFGLLEGLAVWRVVVGKQVSARAFKCCLAVAIVTALLMATAGYWGGEMLLAP